MIEFILIFALGGIAGWYAKKYEDEGKQVWGNIKKVDLKHKD